MPYLKTSEEWQHQSALLLEARPTTARITTKYTIPNLSSPKYLKKASKSQNSTQESRDTASATDTATEKKTPRAYLEMRTFDPVSGVTLKYKTDKAAEVGRLVGVLGRLGRGMAALPEEKEDTVMADAPAEKDREATDAGIERAAGTTVGGGGGGQAGKKKKKGKR